MQLTIDFTKHHTWTSHKQLGITRFTPINICKKALAIGVKEATEKHENTDWLTLGI